MSGLAISSLQKLAIVGGLVLTAGCWVGSGFIGAKMTKMKLAEKDKYTVEKLDVKENSKTATQENVKTQDLTDNKTINKDNDMEL